MPRSVAIFFSLLFLSTLFVGMGWGMAYRLTPEHRRQQAVRWLLVWSLKGLLLPLLVWTVMNLGISFELQPFMPQIQDAQSAPPQAGRNWVLPFVRFVGYGAFIISTDWTAITLVWAVLKSSVGLVGEPRADLKALCWTCALALFVPAALIVGLGGWPTVGLGAITMLGPMAGYAPAILRTKKLPPMYARAVAKLKFGKYSEAEWEIINELEKCEDDFEGWLMLAELYANQFNDVAEAEATILEICDQPRTSPSQISIALHKLADWYLKLRGDPEAARRALLMISDRLRGTHLAHMAELRLKQLPASAEEYREQQNVHSIPLPALGDSLDEEPPEPEAQLDHDQAVETANTCVERLQHDPDNAAAREKLARICAERLNKADLAIEQITLLLNMPEQPDAKRAEWLGLMAAWHIKYRHDTDSGRKILERLLREFPASPQAFAAQRRIRLMDVELKQSKA